MRILELNIKNYRAFGESQKFVFQPNLTVIAGINGRGKTAILESSCLILSRLLPLISPAKSGYRSLTQLDVHEGQTDIDISIKVNCAGIPLEYSLHYNIERRKIELTKLSKVVRDEIKRAYGDPSRAGDQAPLVVYYTTDRAGYRFPKALPEAVPAGQAMAYSGALKNRIVDYKDLMARINVATANALETSRSTNVFFGEKILNAINNSLNIFLDGFSNLRVVQDPLRLVADKQGETLDIRQLSDGERSFIAMICDLSRRLALANPELEDPRLGAGVVFIDEIELHLHPKWQLEITEKLRTTFPNIQFIVTTHSPFILQTTREGEVISLDNDQIVVDPSGKSLEEVAKYVMDVENTEYSPRIKKMRQTARKYLELVKEAKVANEKRKAEIQLHIEELLEPFSDNPAYTAFLESKSNK
jgi:predicted ATP-binding protein involved in virulence